MIRAPLLVLLPFLVAGLGAGAENLRSPVILPADYTTIPASPVDMAAQVATGKVTLVQAIDAATRATGGVAGSAQIGGPRGAPIYEVVTYVDGKAYLVVVDGQSGAVTSKTEVHRFPGDPTQDDWVESPTGLKYFELRPGTGDKAPSTRSSVKVHYTGWLLDGRKFDSSYDRNEPATFALNRVIKGWTEGVGEMSVGAKRKLIIPAALAYGDQPPPRSSIPPKATLVFDVELLEVQK